MRKHWSIGDICDSKFWASLELKPNCGHGFHIGKTYNGTITGLIWCFGFGVIIAHIREIER